MEEIKRFTYDLNPRIYLASIWLSTYSHIRGIELLNIKEKDIDLKTGRIEVYRTKEKKSKIITLLDEDVEYIRSQPTAFPELFFFRHLKKIPGLPPIAKLVNNSEWLCLKSGGGDPVKI